MVFRKPSQREKETYKKYADRFGFAVQTAIAAGLILLLAAICFVGNNRAGKITAAVFILLIDQKFIRYAVKMFYENQNYKKGEYEVTAIEINPKNLRYRSIGGKNRCEITTYKVPELETAIDIASDSLKKIMKEKRAVLIKMQVMGKCVYYLTHHVE